MKKIVLLLILGLFLCGCLSTASTSPTSVTYKSFKTGEIAYKNGLGIANDLYNQDRITKVEKDKIVALAWDYKIAFVAASTALETYKSNPSISNKESMDALQANAEELLGEFKRWLYERQ